MTLNSKIREIISAYGLSDRQFAIRIGVAQSVIGSMFQKGTEPSAKVIKGTLNAFPDISADWFFKRFWGNVCSGEFNGFSDIPIARHHRHSTKIP